MSRRATKRALVVAILAAACACENRRAKPPPFADGPAAFPADTRTLIAVRVAKVQASPLARRLVEWMLEADPAQRNALAMLLAACRIEPARDVDSVLIGMGAAPSEVAIVARGRFDEKALTACVRGEVEKKKGRFEEKKLHGRAVLGALDAESSTWIALDGSGSSLVITTSEGALAKVLDPATPRASGNAVTMDLVGRIGTDAGAWGVAHLDPAAGERIAGATGGAVSAGPTSLSGELVLDDGAGVTVVLDLPSEADAAALAEFARSQHMWLALGAQKLGLGRIVNKVSFEAEGARVTISLRLDPAEIGQLVEALDKLAQK